VGAGGDGRRGIGTTGAHGGNSGGNYEAESESVCVVVVVLVVLVLDCGGGCRRQCSHAVIVGGGAAAAGIAPTSAERAEWSIAGADEQIGGAQGEAQPRPDAKAPRDVWVAPTPAEQPAATCAQPRRQPTSGTA
jgi:hypothetical protein